MPAGCAIHPTSDSPAVIVCAQGTLKEPGGLVKIDVRRPHRATMLLNNFHGRPFNSPCDIAANLVDGCVYFTDPAYGFERGFRPKPRLPSGHIYRYDPESADCRVVAHGLSRPASLAFSPDFSVLYVSELADKYGGTYIHAFDLTYPPGLRPAASFDISVARSQTSENHHHQHTPSSSTDSSNRSKATSHVKFTPNSSPQYTTGAGGGYPSIDGRTSLSRTNSRAEARGSGTDMSHHTQLTNLGRRSPVRGGQQPSQQGTGVTGVPIVFRPRAQGTFLRNKRLFAYSPSVAPSGGIACDPTEGNVWLGTEEGVEVWSAAEGELVGKICVEEFEEPADLRVSVARATAGEKEKKTSKKEKKAMRGVSKVSFVRQGEALLLGGERMWRVRMRGRGGGSWT